MSSVIDIAKKLITLKHFVLIYQNKIWLPKITTQNWCMLCYLQWMMTKQTMQKLTQIASKHIDCIFCTSHSRSWMFHTTLYIKTYTSVVSLMYVAVGKLSFNLSHRTVALAFDGIQLSCSLLPSLYWLNCEESGLTPFGSICRVIGRWNANWLLLTGLYKT